MTKSCAAALLAAFVLAGPAAAQMPSLSERVRKHVALDEPVVVVKGVTVLDGRGTPARRDQTVVIREGRIAYVGGPTAAPAGAHVIDGAGKTLIPGLVGLHDHMFYMAAGGYANQMSFTGPRLYLASGVTTVRTTGGTSPYADLNLRHDVDAGLVPGPRIHVTTPYLNGGKSAGDMFATDDPVAARRFVRYWAGEGATWVKFYANVSRATMKAAIEEAKKAGIRTTGHLCSVTFREAVELGIDDLAHGALTATDFVTDKQPDKCPPDYYRLTDSLATAEGPIATSLIRLMVQRGVSMTTTMPIFEAMYPRRPVQDERSLALMAPAVREAYLRNRAFIDSVPNWVFTPDGFERALAFDRAFFDAGGILASGVDPTGNGGALPGYGDQRGYELLREAGLSAEQAVQVVTYNGARVLGVAKELGSVEQGKLADLVLLRGDLAADPSVIRNVEIVFKGGVGYDPASLIEAVRGRVGID